MRTVKLELFMPGPNDRAPSMRFSTEVIAEEDEAHEAGIEAGRFLMAFSMGVATHADDDDE